VGLNFLGWAKSQMVGGVSEIALFTPIIDGRVPGERRMYEERLRFVLTSLGDRAQQRKLTPLSEITTFHFARVLIIRPEHYLLNSNLPKPMRYRDRYRTSNTGPERRAPQQIDDYPELGKAAKIKEWECRSWLLTLVIFDGGAKAYVRDIVEFIGKQFDLVFENCEDYPYTHNFEAFWAWARRFQLPVDVFYSAYPDLSVVRIKQLEDFKRRFDAFVAKVRSPNGRKVEPMDDLFDEFLRETNQYASDFPAPGGVYLTDRPKG